jgi:hypothetical protein
MFDRLNPWNRTSKAFTSGVDIRCDRFAGWRWYRVLQVLSADGSDDDQMIHDL